MTVTLAAGILLAASLGSSATAQSPSVRDDKMAPYRVLADEALKVFKAGDLAGAKKKAKELEKAWDTNSKADLAKKPELWKEIDTALDTFIDPLMKEAAPDAAKVQAAHKEFLAKLAKASAN